jgi:YidC/Oxa1 family membrane protein insertase
MDNFRLFLFFGLALILLMLWQAWEQQYAPVPAPTAPAANGAKSPSSPDVPKAPTGTSGGDTTATPKASVESLASAERIAVTTDTVNAVIDTQGGDLRELALRQYPVAIDRPREPFVLMRDAGPEAFVAQSGLIGHAGQFPNHKIRFTAEAKAYELKKDQDELRVPLSWKSPEGVRYTKTYIFRRGNYVVDVEFRVENATRQEWSGYFYGQFQRAHVPQSGIFNVVPSYTGGAFYTPENHYEKIALDEMAKKPLKREATGGWVAMLQHYFVGSWLPPQDGRHEFYTDVPDSVRHVLGYKDLVPTKIAAGQTGVLRSSLYAGPKEQKLLEQLPEGMDLTVDYGWLTVISAPLFWLLAFIHRWVGNWGWAIILLTILIKLAFYPLSAASYKSMAHMKKMQPKLQALKERYGDDKQKLNQAMMELYKTEKINPLGGCLPILIQIPVFIALYWVLLESVEMRQAPFILWIKDLSAQDPYYVLPIVMGISMFAQQKLNPQPLDPIQQKVFMFMPLFFTVFFLFFPAGLVLYWTVNNILSIAQQWQINRTIGAHAK